MKNVLELMRLLFGMEEFLDEDEEVEIICRKHGSFFVTPKNHLGMNREGIAYGCPQCRKEKLH